MVLWLLILGPFLTWSLPAESKNLQKKRKPTIVVMPDQFRGFIDHSGSHVLSVPYDWFGSFHEGLAAMRDRDRNYGYIDRSGKIVIKPQFDNARDFSEGLAAVKVGDNWGYVDHNGKFVIAPAYKAAGEFSEGLARVFIRYRDYKEQFKGVSSALIDRNGSFAIHFDVFDSIEGIHEGAAVARKGNRYFYVDRNGHIENESKYGVPSRLIQGVASVWVSSDKVGFIDRTSQLLCQTIGQRATPFSEGLSIVHDSRSKSLKVIDLAGKIVCQLSNLDFASRFSEGCAIVGVAGTDNSSFPRKFDHKLRRLFVDRKGRKLFDEDFHSALPFSEGLAAVNFSIFGPYPREESFEPRDFFPDLYTLEQEIPYSTQSQRVK